MKVPSRGRDCERNRERERATERERRGGGELNAMSMESYRDMSEFAVGNFPVLISFWSVLVGSVLPFTFEN